MKSFGSIPVYAIDVTLNVYIQVLTMLYYSIKLYGINIAVDNVLHVATHEGL